jgi:hypothetical protein
MGKRVLRIWSLGGRGSSTSGAASVEIVDRVPFSLQLAGRSGKRPHCFPQFFGYRGRGH